MRVFMQSRNMAVSGSCFEKTPLNEFYAHAALGKLQERTLKDSEFLTLLLHTAEKRKYIHSNDFVHMDLNAGNNFLTKVPI